MNDDGSLAASNFAIALRRLSEASPHTANEVVQIINDAWAMQGVPWRIERKPPPERSQ